MIGVIFIIYGLVTFFFPEIMHQSPIVAELSQKVGIVLMSLGVGFIIGYQMADAEKMPKEEKKHN